ncbi:uncharacterized protein LOC134216166 [Armigeres subalbatus]|uniref:uncharacterized protein LOC134216166 n=1 Tax=Armigeres subalbatus TaxID=124917 RepID=UPI002ED2DCE6
MSKMSMNINTQQVEELTRFMEDHPDLARGILCGAEGRHHANKLWNNLTRKLNEKGPPVREVKDWKKVWADYKYNVKNKLRKNISSIRKTGGGPNQTKQLNPFEESVVRSAGLEAAVQGVDGGRSFGTSTSYTKLPESLATFGPSEEIADETQWVQEEEQGDLPGDDAATANYQPPPAIIYQNETFTGARRRTNYKAEKLSLFKRYVEALEEDNNMKRELLELKKRKYDLIVRSDDSSFSEEQI